MTYSEFRSGYTFERVRQQLAGEQQAAKASGEYMYVTRRTVLGRMHYLKMHAWESYQKEMARNVA